MKKKTINTNKAQTLYEDAKTLIPGGTMLFSKKPELHLPNLWPNYFSKVKDCYVWDISGNKFVDMMFYVGTNTLGYSNKKIDNEVIKSIKKGNLSTLNNYEEIILAKKLVKLHPWADMVRFARTGGEANAISVRIARSISKKQNIAVCGYHGWHDWYLAANLNNKTNLNKHLVKGIDTGGIHKNLKNTVFTFDYGNFAQLEKIVNKNNIGIIKMELSRSTYPDLEFLTRIRKLCNKRNIILIYDECTSGFRETLGGLHLKYNKFLYPDIAMFGKALGNGFAINAILGKRKYMKNISNSFISSTFWTEKVGTIAALSTLKEMQRIKSWKIIKERGKLIKKNWLKIFDKYNLKTQVNGIDSLPSFVFDEDNALKKTFITQEMLKKGYLASNIIYVSTAHKPIILKNYFKNFEIVVKKISELKKNKLIALLENRECDTGLKRFN
jgi:glutamate-1-semialdehyde 2,1-aminomutase